MKNRSLLILLSSIILCSLLTACSSEQRDQADVNDESVFSPPEIMEGIPGIWSTEFNTLTQNNYFYGDGKFVSFTQDPEEETWCMTAYWDETDQKITLSEIKYYKYNNSDGKWLESEEKIGFTQADQSSDTEITISEQLPDGKVVSANSSKNEKEIQIPSDVEISEIINEFLIH